MAPYYYPTLRSRSLSLAHRLKGSGFFCRYDLVALGSGLSMRSFARLGSSLSLFGTSRYGASVSVADFLALGSSLSLRAVARLGSHLSVCGYARFGSVLPSFLSLKRCASDSERERR